jgi:hypothetical protein
VELSLRGWWPCRSRPRTTVVTVSPSIGEANLVAVSSDRANTLEHVWLVAGVIGLEISHLATSFPRLSTNGATI